MTAQILGIFSALIFGSVAMADFKLANSGKAVVCYADDNQSWEINAKRTAIEYTVEGETSGPLKIVKRRSDGSTFVSYTTVEGTLSLDDKGDSFRAKGETQAVQISCD